MSEDVKKLAIEAVLNNWFTTVYNKKKHTTKIRINNEYFRRQCISAFNKLSKSGVYRDSFEDFKADYARNCYDIMQEFQPEKHKSNWHDVLVLANDNSKSDKSIISALGAYVVASVSFKTVDEYSEKYIRFGRNTGKKLYLKVESYDKKISDMDDDEVGSLLENSNNIHAIPLDKIYSSQINNWFQTNKEKILTKSQLETLELWDTFNIFNPLNDELEEHFGVKQNTIIQKIQKLGPRTLKAFNKENPLEMTPQQIIAAKEKVLIEPFIKAKSKAEKYIILFEIFSEIQMNLKLNVNEHIKLNLRIRDDELLDKVAKQLNDKYKVINKIVADVKEFEYQEEVVNKPSIRPKWLGNLADQARQSDAKVAYIVGGDGLAVMGKEDKNIYSEVRTYSLDELETVI